MAASSAALGRPVLCCLSTFPLRFYAPNNHYGNVPGCRLKATHELEERGGGEGGAGCTGWEPPHLEASMEFHREKHLVPFLWAGSNVRRQNAALWVNLQLLLFGGRKDPPPLSHCPFSPPPPTQSSCPKLLLTRTISQLFQDRPSPRPSRAYTVEGDSFSHTLCIMFASFRWTNNAAALAAICSAGRIFNYFSRPWHLGLCNRSFSDDIFWESQLRCLNFSFFTFFHAFCGGNRH